ncbi:hypothetical protein, partial [Legionella santicrucis]|uniref:hypothetical protein n=1 Tax=Legionella santicrucis TaxID=45074 RepID=UPI001ED9BE91
MSKTNPKRGGVDTIWQPDKQSLLQTHMVPHARTLRKAREQVKWMVKESSSHPSLLKGSPLRTERATFTALRSSSHK